jgi:hypothetical protein
MAAPKVLARDSLHRRRSSITTHASNRRSNSDAMSRSLSTIAMLNAPATLVEHDGPSHAKLSAVNALANIGGADLLVRFCCSR